MKFLRIRRAMQLTGLSRMTIGMDARGHSGEGRRAHRSHSSDHGTSIEGVLVA